MNATVLSIIIPAYNCEKFLQDCIDSIFPQVDEPVNEDIGMEVILVDDGSNDDTGKICDQNSELNPRIRVIHQDNKGVSAARNTGIKNAKGDWILFVDADDYIDISTILELLRKPGLKDYDMVGFSFEMERPNHKVKVFSDTGNWYEYDVDKNRKLFQKLCLQNQMYWPNVVDESYKYPIMTLCWNKLYRKVFLQHNSIFMPENIAQHEDRIFNYKCIEFCKKIVHYDKIAYRYKYHPSSAVHTDGLRMINQMRETLRCFYCVIGEDNSEILDGAFAYASAQMLWTIIDRLGSCCESIGDLSIRSKEIKQFMDEPILRGTFKKIHIRNINSFKHRIICMFLKFNITSLPILVCCIYHKCLEDKGNFAE